MTLEEMRRMRAEMGDVWTAIHELRTRVEHLERDAKRKDRGEIWADGERIKF